MDTAQRESYRFRPPLILKFALAVLLGQRRDMSADADATLSGAQPTPRTMDDRHVPTQGPFVLIANHYERPGLKVFWGGMLASAAVGRRRGESKGLHWLMTSEWYDFRISFLPVPVWLIRWLFRRLADVYGLIIVPRATAKLVGRAAAMRSILQVVDGNKEPSPSIRKASAREHLSIPNRARGPCSFCSPTVVCPPFRSASSRKEEFSPPVSVRLCYFCSAEYRQGCAGRTRPPTDDGRDRTSAARPSLGCLQGGYSRIIRAGTG